MRCQQKSPILGVKAKHGFTAKKTGAKPRPVTEDEATLTVDRRNPERRDQPIAGSARFRLLLSTGAGSAARRSTGGGDRSDHLRAGLYARRDRVHQRHGRLQAAQRADVSDLQRGVGGPQVVGLRKCVEDGRDHTAAARRACGFDAREPRGRDAFGGRLSLTRRPGLFHTASLRGDFPRPRHPAPAARYNGTVGPIFAFLPTALP